MEESNCFVCGKNNPHGLKLNFTFKDRKSNVVFIPEKRFQGFKNIIHGGIISTVLDEAMGNLAFHLGLNAVTSKLEVSLIKPTIVGEKYFAQGEIVEERGRVVHAKASLSHENGQKVAEAIAYAKKTKTRLYLCHISLEEEIECIKKARRGESSKKSGIYAEVTPHHLFLTEADF